ncbi:hypothetical protein FB45DRAFT_888957 [Roridomyces roridus]|uniref:F-box domain-containing protein n=1 Tax=Roridomyces roridus TaxID=1738132 RepID=A0AAD7G2V8_9AGAR|nr:hypothetical protein FB45DRAFT_888957 [Roridomyces roridus]
MADAAADPKASRAFERVRVVQIDAEIDALEHRIRLLKVERVTRQQRLEAFRYPVLTLPNEIVSEIFVHFLPPYPLCPPFAGLLSPTTLTQICQKWRDVAQTTPRLWRAISLPRRALKRPVGDEEGWLLESWVSRSARCPLSISMDGRSLISWDSNRTLGGLILHRDRWEHLDIDFCYKLDLAKVIGAPMPLLRTLSFKESGVTADPVLFRDVPLLRSLSTDSLSCRADFLPWSQLTFLKLSNPGTFLHIPLRETVNLQHLELFITGEHEGEGIGDIRLPQLETLLISPCWALGSRAVTQFLDAFTLPRLRTLQIPDAFLGEEPVHALSSFISRSACKLQTAVIIVYGLVFEDAYREALPTIPDLSFIMKENYPESLYLGSPEF